MRDERRGSAGPVLYRQLKRAKKKYKIPRKRSTLWRWRAQANQTAFLLGFAFRQQAFDVPAMNPTSCHGSPATPPKAEGSEPEPTRRHVEPADFGLLLRTPVSARGEMLLHTSPAQSAVQAQSRVSFQEAWGTAAFIRQRDVLPYPSRKKRVARASETYWSKLLEEDTGRRQQEHQGQGTGPP
jgi:hypothetical protein